jgi:hypothetical protein
MLSFLQKEETKIEETQTGDMFTSKEHYLEFTAAFKAWAKARKPLNSSHFLLYAILRNRDWTKGWTTPLKAGKLLENAYKRNQAFYAIKSPHFKNDLLAPFGETITQEMLERVRSELDEIRKEGEK